MAIQLDFRPETYFGPCDPQERLLRSIKGTQRRAYVREMVDQHRADEVPRELMQPSLPPDLRRSYGAQDPSFSGGEYLPDLEPGEVEIARVTLASTYFDVIGVYAREANGQIHYRAVDEHQGDLLGEETESSSTRPLTLDELVECVLTASDLFGIRDMDFPSDDGPPDQIFFAASSEFYPDFEALLRERVEHWVRVFRDQAETE
jgi:hypothetical protein